MSLPSIKTVTLYIVLYILNFNKNNDNYSSCMHAQSQIAAAVAI